MIKQLGDHVNLKDSVVVILLVVSVLVQSGEFIVGIANVDVKAGAAKYDLVVLIVKLVGQGPTT